MRGWGFVKKKLSKIIILVVIFIFCLYGIKKVAGKFGIHILEKSNIETNYEHE